MRRSEEWIRRWMYREKKKERRGKRRISAPISARSSLSTTSTNDPSPSVRSEPLLQPETHSAAGLESFYSYAQPLQDVGGAGPSIAVPNPLSSIAVVSGLAVPPDEDCSHSHSVFPGILSPAPLRPLGQFDKYTGQLRALARSPSLGYIPYAFPYDLPVSATAQNEGRARSPSEYQARTDGQYRKELQHLDQPPPALVPSSTFSTLPSVPSLDLLSTFDDPASTAALIVDSSQSNFACLSELLHEAEMAYAPLNYDQRHGYSMPRSLLGQTQSQVSDGGQHQVPVSVNLNYESLYTSSYYPSTALQHQTTATNPIVEVATRMRTVSGSNMSFAPSLQSHSTSLYADIGLGLSDNSTSVPNFNSFYPPAQYGYGQGQASTWTAQHVQSFTLGTRRIDAMNTPQRTSSKVAGDPGMQSNFGLNFCISNELMPSYHNAANDSTTTVSQSPSSVSAPSSASGMDMSKGSLRTSPSSAMQAGNKEDADAI